MAKNGSNVSRDDGDVLHPLVKWAGGKTQLLDTLESKTPPVTKDTSNRLSEAGRSYFG